MSESFIGEIRIFAGNFAPRAFAFCDGQLIAVTQNDALFSLFGTIYGGDGRTTFGLPDLRGRVPIHYGTGPGLPTYRIGQKGGAESETLTVQQMPSHRHAWQASTGAATGADPSNNFVAQTQADIYNEEDPERTLNTGAMTKLGGGQSHTNLMPTLCVNFIVALYGIYPSRA